MMMMCEVGGFLLTDGAFFFCSDRFIDAIPGTYDEAEGKKYEGVNRLVMRLHSLRAEAGLLTSSSGEYLVKRLTATY